MMTSAPPAHQVQVSPEMFEFFQVELRNEAQMIVDAHGDRDKFPPSSTLGSAHDSLCQAPEDVIVAWFHNDNPNEYSVTHQLIEFGELLATYGDDAELKDFICEDDLFTAPEGWDGTRPLQ